MKRAVITKPVSPYALFAGNPANLIGWISEYGHRLLFNEAGVALCPESGQQYLLQDQSVSRLV